MSARREFIETVKRHQRGLERARTVGEARSYVASLRRWVKPEGGTVALSEYDRLATQSFAGYRGIVSRPAHGERESVPPHLRALLDEVYGGRCQMCDFTFLKQDKTPYYEIHHLFPMRGHHPKNLVVSCANCHRQFEHAATKLQMDEQTWLIAVTFNTIRHSVYQAVLRAQLRPPMKQVHEM
ncbi:MAG: HNH endonuclease signature motif containing protein [candidate division WOR-3 bacterium]|nr:HNH endonuclease signature motif containing protein [candidate division WOR-3 bacterium]